MEITLPTMENHGIVFSNFCENPVLRMQRLMRLFNLFSQTWAKMFDVPIRSKCGWELQVCLCLSINSASAFCVHAIFSTQIDRNHFKLHDYNFN